MVRLLKYIFVKNISSPVYLIHLVTNKCNAKCPHCFVTPTQNNSFDNELTLAEIEKITKSFSRDIFNVNLTGGEPFLRDDLVEIVKLYRQNAHIESFLIATNGFFLDKTISAVENILGDNKNLKLTISLSLDHIGEKHDKIRRVAGLYDKVINLYRELLRMHNRRLSVQVNLTIQRDNHKDAEQIFDHLVRKEKITNFNVSLIRGISYDSMASGIDYENYFKVNQLIDNYLNQGYIQGFENSYLSLLNTKNQISRRLIEETVRNKSFISTCFAGALTGVLCANGDVYPCELYKEKIGNIRNFGYNFKSIWTSKKAINMRSEIVKNKCFCTHECNWTTNILFNARYLPELAVRFLRIRLKTRRKF